MKTIVQSDFDGTITYEDVSFLLLDNFADGDWRQLFNEYMEGKIPVSTFNTRAFAMVKADKQTLLDYMFRSGNIKIRTGFNEVLAYCSKNGFKLVIVSNGLDFYIEAILRDIGVENIGVFAAQTQFSNNNIQVEYIGPDGRQLQEGFKDAYTELFLKEGYRVVYVGNGASDLSPAKLSHHVFATGTLLDYCNKTNLDCTPFADFNDVVRGLELLPQE